MWGDSNSILEINPLSLFKWHRPSSTRDAIEMIYHNLFRGTELFLLWVGYVVAHVTIKSIRTCCGFRKPHYVADRAQARYREEYEPTALPTRRKRALTIPLPTVNPNLTWHMRKERPQITYDQTKSKLIHDLPLEIRHQIYQYMTFGGQKADVFHVFRDWREINYWQCSKPVNGLPCCWGTRCSQVLPLNILDNDEWNYNPKRYIRPERLPVISMMRTCRQVYSEMIPILYSAHFHFPYGHDIAWMDLTLLPRRLASIRKISLNWPPGQEYLRHPYPAFDEEKWRETWDTLSRMKGLRELRVHPKFSRHVLEDPSFMLSPPISLTRDLMKKVKGLDVFELKVTESQKSYWDGFIEEDMEIRLVIEVRVAMKVPCGTRDYS